MYSSVHKCKEETEKQRLYYLPHYQALIFSFRTVHLLFFLPLAISSLVTRRSQPLYLQEKNRSYVRQEVAGRRRATKEKEIGFQR